MRVFALSDLHIDYPVNRDWVDGLSRTDYRDDLLLLGGDVSDSLARLRWCFEALVSRFRRVVFVPGNHELWVVRDGTEWDSLAKFEAVRQLAHDTGVGTQPVSLEGVSVVPPLGWYDYSFGTPGPGLEGWVEFQACRWPAGWTAHDITTHFLQLNEGALAEAALLPRDGMRISFSHFLPRIDVMPDFIPPERRVIYPVLGAARLGEQVRALRPDLHVYGHSHVNQRVVRDGTLYINNAFGYPREVRIAAKQLLCVHTT
jgi:predicted phosphodiesterase